jgi:hypothetical protein
MALRHVDKNSRQQSYQPQLLRGSSLTTLVPKLLRMAGHRRKDVPLRFEYDEGEERQLLRDMDRQGALDLSSDGADVSQRAMMIVREEPRVLRALWRQACRSTSLSQRILALAMARHPRLGAESPARLLTRDLLRVIRFHLRPRQSLYICGGRWMVGAHSRLNANSPPCELQDLFELDLVTGEWSRLRDMPTALWGHCCAYRPEQQELWVFGGAGNRDCFVYASRTDTWTVIKEVCDDADIREGAACVIYRDRVLIIGGGQRSQRNVLVPAQTDVMFDLATGEFHNVPEV